jgi:hypothetical protein
MKMIGENRSTRRKTCTSATLSTTNPTQTNPGSKPGLRGERQAINRLRAQHLTIRAKENHVNLKQDSRTLSREWSSVSPEQKAGVLPFDSDVRLQKFQIGILNSRYPFIIPGA